ncbi:hypothetical protein L873DRAFT_1810506 [Choiromyces venosus 120613-1]|uniref:Uncharacterized protein n=1 Tax=Choiromyces venosus 120613-1 TaxID=1336337 RepID=A0A3N4JFE6_9PEZI|nr:hypothetical protein L873DRAFT_1810506 [Choiromyces venosus 120613-1]
MKENASAGHGTNSLNRRNAKRGGAPKKDHNSRKEKKKVKTTQKEGCDFFLSLNLKTGTTSSSSLLPIVHTAL